MNAGFGSVDLVYDRFGAFPARRKVDFDERPDGLAANAAGKITDLMSDDAGHRRASEKERKQQRGATIRKRKAHGFFAQRRRWKEGAF